jgi:hypothetical protein
MTQTNSPSGRTEDDLVKQVAELRENAHKSGKEGAGMHRNAGDSGRVGALYMEAAKELDALLALAVFDTTDKPQGANNEVKGGKADDN